MERTLHVHFHSHLHAVAARGDDYIECHWWCAAGILQVTIVRSCILNIVLAMLRNEQRLPTCEQADSRCAHQYRIAAQATRGLRGPDCAHPAPVADAIARCVAVAVRVAAADWIARGIVLRVASPLCHWCHRQQLQRIGSRARRLLSGKKECRDHHQA